MRYRNEELRKTFQHYGHSFPDGSKVWLAQEGFELTNSRAVWQWHGVKPDVETHADWDEFSFESDPALPVALKLIERR